jgi:hypothetical protein
VQSLNFAGPTSDHVGRSLAFFMHAFSSRRDQRGILRAAFVGAICALAIASTLPVFASTESVGTEKPEVFEPRFAAVRSELLAIREEDQKYREQIETLLKKTTHSSPEAQAVLQKMKAADAANLPKVEAILAQHGWLGPDEIGPQASGALFLVIQHADLPVQQKYLPVMRAAVKAGKARGAALALLEDRVALAEGRPQTYGSQLRREGDGPLFVQAIDDPDHVDERRAAVGLPPMVEYLKHWNLTWNLEAYKKQLPELLAKLKQAAAPIPAPPR